MTFSEEDGSLPIAPHLTLYWIRRRILKALIDSFALGKRAVKEGIPVAIVGAPNVGKSTPLNALPNEEKAGRGVISPAPLAM